MSTFDHRPSRLAALPLALIFLFETWVWSKLLVVARLLATLFPWERFRDAARRVVNRLPAIFAVMLFSVPLAVSEFGAFISVVMMATGHVFAGMGLYVLMKLFGLFLVPVIFEITREKLLALPWFAFLYAKFDWLHERVKHFVAPYRAAARDMLREFADLARRAWRDLAYGSRSAARASAAKAETLASSARAVGSNPASPSH